MVRIGLLGCGTIGSGVVELVSKNPLSIQGISIEKILVRNMEKHLNKPYSVKLTNKFEDIINSNIDIVIEVMGGLDPAYFYVKQSLLQGRHVVTANKELIAKHGKELLNIARENGVSLLFEASVGGGIPVIKPLKESLAANNISEISGIVNGTTNYILSQMYNYGKSFKEALKEAQVNGYAEADPEADIEGYDAGRKLAILCSIAFRRNIRYENLYLEGISKISLDDILIAKYLGYNIKLLAMGKKEEDKIMAMVVPVMLKVNHPLAQVGDVYNAITVKGDAVGDVLFYGQGAGKFPTASAVLGDVIDIVKNSIGNNKKTEAFINDLPESSVENEDNKSKFFVRIKPKERSSAMGKIASEFNNCKFIFPDKVKLSKSIEDNQIIFITERISEKDFRNRIKNISENDEFDKILSTIRLKEEN